MFKVRYPNLAQMTLKTTDVILTFFPDTIYIYIFFWGLIKKRAKKTNITSDILHKLEWYLYLHVASGLMKTYLTIMVIITRTVE